MENAISRKNALWVCVSYLAMSLLFAGCGDDELPSGYLVEPYLTLENKEINIGIAESFEIAAKASSTWRVISNVDWCTVTTPIANGKMQVICTAKANRTDNKRSCYLVVNTYHKEKKLSDSILVVQEVNDLPTLEVAASAETILEKEGGVMEIKFTYNYGIKIGVDYISGNKDWLSLTPVSFPVLKHDPINELLKIHASANTSADIREARVTIESTKPEIPPVVLLFTQKGEGTQLGITAFSDNFETADSQGAPYVAEGWEFVSAPEEHITFKQFTNGMKALLINGGGSAVTGYGVMPAFNVKAMGQKSLSYMWAPGNSSIAGTEKFEVVASTDYKGDALSATWTVVEDVTNTENPTKIRPLSAKTVSLASLAGETRVYLAFRYTGVNSAYRFDNLKVGDVE